MIYDNKFMVYFTNEFKYCYQYLKRHKYEIEFEESVNLYNSLYKYKDFKDFIIFFEKFNNCTINTDDEKCSIINAMDNFKILDDF